MAPSDHATTTDAESPAYLDPNRSVDERIADLLSRMTLAEKAAQLGSVGAAGLVSDDEFDRDAAEEILGEGIGHVTRIGDETGLPPADAARIANEVQAFLASETRLGVPSINHEECLAGYMGPGGTVIPQAIGLASTWEPELVTRLTDQIRRQLRAIGAHHALSPVLDVALDPRWGRTEETFGEDPYLIAEMATAYVRGLQGDDPETGIVATCKHFVGHGATEGGRNRTSLNVGPRDRREIHMFPFEVAVREGGAGSIMNAYHDVDGIPCAADDRLLTDVLRGEWGFEGVVVSDYFSIEWLETDHAVAANEREAGVLALEAGIDVELPHTKCYGQRLVEAVERDELAEETLDRSVSRLLRQKFEKGLFERRSVDAETAPDAFETEDQRELSREAARKSIVLLENDGLLPLADPGSDELDSIAVVGPKADDGRGMCGDYAYPSRVEADESPVELITPLEGIEDAVGDDVDVIHASGCTNTGPATDGFEEAVEAVAEADVAVAFVGALSAIEFGEVDEAVGPRESTSGEGRDVTDLGLPGVQEELIEAVADAGTPLAVVLVSGRAHAIPEVADTASALVHAWLPGEEGGNAIADALFGEINPGGKLPISVPRTVGQLPVYHHRKRLSRENDYVFETADPLYPFGHGLSYTEFEYDGCRLQPESIGPSGEFSVSVDVENVGDRAGEEVVQLYVRDVLASRSRPVQELRGFRRLSLDPGERRTVTFGLSAHRLAFYDRDSNLVVEPGEFEIRVARSSEDSGETATLAVTGEKKRVPDGRRYLTDVNID